MKIIAFGHRKRVGKDLACNLLFRHLRLNKKDVQKSGFAHELKVICNQLYGWGGLQLPSYYDKPENEYLREVPLEAFGKTPRQMWIEVSQNLKAVYNDTWLNLLVNKYNKANILLISDLRFPNEVDYIKSNGGIVVRIDNPRVPHSDDPADVALANYDGWDQIILNDGTVEEYNTKLINMVTDLI